jgi:hypothetical protein
MRVRLIISKLSVLIDTFSFSAQIYEFISLTCTNIWDLSSYEHSTPIAQLDTRERSHAARVKFDQTIAHLIR